MSPAMGSRAVHRHSSTFLSSNRGRHLSWKEGLGVQQVVDGN